MPAAFVQSEPQIKTIGADVIMDIIRYTYQALPSGVVYTFDVPADPKNTLTPAEIKLTADGWADRWNQNASQPGVVGITVAQQVDAAGNLADVCFVTVQSSSGRSTSQLQGNIEKFFPSLFNPWVANERARMDAIEGESPGAQAGIAAFGEG